MGAIKDLVDLVTQLSNSVEDRKFAGELRQIQSMIGGIQSEHAAMHEQRIDLMTKNADLKNDNTSLKKKISDLERQIANNQTPSSPIPEKLHEEAERVLMFFTKYTEVTAAQISHGVSIAITRTEHWIDTLDEAEMIYASYSMMSETTYSIAPGGRKYLIDNNMI